MADYVEVDHERELKTVIDERQFGVDRPEHVTIIASAVLSERLGIETFLLTQGEHGQKLDALDHKVAVLDGKVAVLDHKVEALDHKVEALDHRVDALDRKMDAGFAAVRGEMQAGFAAVVEAVGKQLEVHSDRVLKGVAAQLETRGIPMSEGERRRYRG